MSDPAQSSPTIASYVAVLLRNGLGIAAFAVVGGVAFTAGALMGPREYQTGAVLLPQEVRELGGSFAGLPSSLGQLTGIGGRSETHFYAELLSSDELLRAVVETRLAALEAERGEQTLVAHFGIMAARDVDAATMQAVERLRRKMRVRVDERSGTVGLRLVLPGKELVVEVARELLREVNRYNVERRRSKARAEREFLADRLAETVRELRQVEDAHVAFLRSNMELRAPALRAEEARLQREVTRLEALTALLSERFEMSRIEEVRDTPVLTIVDHPERIVRPVSRRVAMRAVAGLFGGLFVGVVVAFLRDGLARAGIAGPGDARRAIGQIRRGQPA